MDNAKSVYLTSMSALQKAGLIDNYDENQFYAKSPWYITIFLAACGWLSALFIVAFIALTFLSWFDDSEIVATVLGAILFGGAVAFIKSTKQEFASHLGLALSLAGQAMFIFGLHEWLDMEELALSILFMGFNIIALLLVSQYEHRFVATILAGIGGGLVASQLEMGNFYSGIMLIIVGLAWIYRFELSARMQNFKAFAYGITLCLCQIKTSAIFIGQGVYSSDTGFILAPWLDEVINIVGMLVIGWLLLQKQLSHMSKQTRLLLIASFLGFAVFSFFAHGLALAFALVMIALSQSNRTLLIVAILTGIINLSSYYYLVDYTLLEKSAILMLIAIMCALGSYMASMLAKRGENHA